jgi:CO/xanthine dehydrogenase FAD-binding subunit
LPRTSPIASHPIDDIRGDAAYRIEAALTLLRRAVSDLVETAR